MKQTPEEHFSMTGENPSGFCVYQNHWFCLRKDCTCVCHREDSK